MSCFSYEGAEDLDSLVSHDTLLELSDSECKSDDSSEDSLFGGRNKGKKLLGKRKKITKKPKEKKKPKTIETTNKKKSKITEIIGILSDDDDEDLDDLSIELSSPTTAHVYSESNRALTGALLNIQFESIFF